jgi:hypothetical protein
VRIIERNEGRYEVEVVEFGRVYKWRPEHVVVECDCGGRTALTYAATTCECGVDHAVAVRKELAAIKSGHQSLRPWRSWHSSEDAGIPF